jgi:Domain of unknown function (DUF4037)
MGFVPGLELARRFAGEVVLPLLRDRFPALPCSAALIGAGSDVLGYDTERSTDHDWGPRLLVFLADGGTRRHGTAVTAMLAAELPPRFLAYPTGQVVVSDRGTWTMAVADGSVRHGVVVADLGAWLVGHLGFDPRDGVGTADWLATPTQTLAEVTGGAVFHDGLRQLAAVRERLRWYPDQLWRWVLACQWARIGEEEPFVGRCGEVGDEVGSAVVAARQARDLMRLHLLMARRYPPYGKWLGTAFARLPDGPRLAAELSAALAATDWHDREHLLGAAYRSAAAAHDALGLTIGLDPTLRPFHDRPFQVLGADRYATALRATVTRPDLPPTGAVDQWIDNTPALSTRDTCRTLTEPYRRQTRPRGPPHDRPIKTLTAPTAACRQRARPRSKAP